MKTKFIEATDATQFNWGKFMIGRFDPGEWARLSMMPMMGGVRLLVECGWTGNHLLVLDLETGEGSIFRPSVAAAAACDLGQKHQIWVCPLFEPFLVWLYQQDLNDLDALPGMVNLGNVPTALAGYRRERA